MSETGRSVPAMILIGMALISSAIPALAQSPATATPAPDQVPGQPLECCTIPAGTLIEIENVDDLGSRRSHTRDTFAIRLAGPIMIDGRTVVHVGATGVGEVIHAARSGGGLGGELILAARYLDVGGVRIMLRGMRFAETGADGRMSWMSGPGYVAMTRGSGGNIEVPAGTRHKAVVAAGIFVPAG